MAGLEKIIQSIDERAAAAESEILQDAQKRADAIRAAGQQDAQKAYKKAMKQTEAELDRQLENAKSSAAGVSARKVLRFKVEQVQDVLRQVRQRLHDLPEPEYFRLILSLIRQNRAKGEGVLYFGERDLKRLPADFETVLKKEMPENSFRIARQAADIADGFILQYGDIEQNCTFDAILEEKSDEMKDLISQTLFS